MTQDLEVRQARSLPELRNILGGEQSMEQFAAALPEDVSVQKFTRALLTANPSQKSSPAARNMPKATARFCWRACRASR